MCGLFLHIKRQLQGVTNQFYQFYVQLSANEIFSW